LDEDLWSKKRVNDIVRMVKPKKNEQILDLGCGIGVVSLECAKRGSNVLALDFSSNALAKTNMSARKLGVSGKINLVQANADALPLKPSKLTKVVAADLVEHLYPQQFKFMLQECNRALRAGGELHIYTPNPDVNPILVRTIGILERFVKRFKKTTSKISKSISLKDGNGLIVVTGHGKEALAEVLTIFLRQ